MRIFRTVAIALLGAGLLTSTVAEAKKDKGASEESAEEAAYITINNETRIGEFNPTWTDAKAIQDKVTSFETNLNGITTEFNTALGVATDAPLQTAIDDLKEKAAGKLQVALDGGKPKITAADGIPENVQAGIDALNGGVDKVMQIIEDAKSLPADIQALVDTAKAFPAQLTPDLLSKNNLKIKDLKAETGVVKDNTKGLIETQDRLKGVVDAATSFVDAVKGLAG
jgi:hypothetical protein